MKNFAKVAVYLSAVCITVMLFSAKLRPPIPDKAQPAFASFKTVVSHEKEDAKKEINNEQNIKRIP